MKDWALGRRIEELDTPVLLLDLDIMEANIATMAEFFAGVEANLRPHMKTHKCAIIARKQLEAGAIGITCAKLGEAGVAVEGGIRDILIANQVVGAHKIVRLMSLAKQADMMVAVDDSGNAEELSRAAQEWGARVRVLVEVDVGLHRCGVQVGEELVALAQQVERSPGLTFAGLMGYEGHAVDEPELQERRRLAEEAMHILNQAKELVEDAGLVVGLMSGGATGTYNITGLYPNITEVQAGSYVVMDSWYRGLEGLDTFGIALSVLATIISRPTPDRAITDAGLKAHTLDLGLPVVKGVLGARVTYLSEEHGHLELEGEARSLHVGDKIEIYPSHCCTTINLHDFYYCIRGGRVEAVWDIAARGKSR